MLGGKGIGPGFRVSESLVQVCLPTCMCISLSYHSEDNIGALIIRIGFGGPLYYNHHYHKEHPKLM